MAEWHETPWHNRSVRRWDKEPTKSLMICGSQRPSDQMLTCARVSAMRITQTTGWQVIVGDDYGIDAAAIAICQEYKLRYLCVGINAKPRNGASMSNYQRLQPNAPSKAYQYKAVNRYLVDMAELVICISNGSLDETMAVYQYAQQQGREAHLKHFDSVL